MWNINDLNFRKKYTIEILEKRIIRDLEFTINRSFTPSYMKQLIREIALSETRELSFDKIQSKFLIPKTTFYKYLNIL